MLPDRLGVEKEREIRRLRGLFAGVQRIPEHRRDAECADDRALIILRLLLDLGEDCRDLRASEIRPPA